MLDSTERSSSFDEYSFPLSSEQARVPFSGMSARRRIPRIFPPPCRCKAFSFNPLRLFWPTLRKDGELSNGIGQRCVFCRVRGASKLKRRRARKQVSPAWPKARNARCRGKCWVSKRNFLFPLCRRHARSVAECAIQFPRYMHLPTPAKGDTN